MTAGQRVILVVTAILMGALPLQARDSDESMMLLKEAMMDSNKDYNQHKKQANHEEFDRVEQWGHRNAGTIMIDGKEATLSDLKEYKILQGDKTWEDRETAAVKQED